MLRPSLPMTSTILPGIPFVTAAVLAYVGLICRWLFDRATVACERVSDQCADAGFAWEALGALLWLAACIALAVGLSRWALRWLRAQSGLRQG